MTLNIFVYSSLFNALVAFVMAVMVARRSGEQAVDKLFFLLNIAVCFWSGWYFIMLVFGQSQALLFARLLTVASIFISVFYIHWIFKLIKKKPFPFFVPVVYVLALIFAVLSFNDLMIQGIKKISIFGAWPVAGPLYIWYILLFYISIPGLGLLYLLIDAAYSTDKNIKASLYLIGIGSLVGFGGGIFNFPLWFGVDILPYGNFVVFGYSLFLGYAFVKFRLMNMQLAITEFLTGVLIFLAFVNVFFARSAQDLFLRMPILLLVVVAGWLLVRSIRKDIKSKAKIEELAGDLKRANEELLALDRAKSEFISIASHQLRTPLSITKGYISMIMEGHFGDIGGKLKDVLSRIYISNERLIHLVNEFLNLSRIEAGTLSYDIQKINLEDVLNSLVHTFSEEAKKKGVKLVWKTPAKKIPQIEGDSEKLIHVFSNLIDNALRYTKKGSIEISADVDTEAEKEYILIKVKDTGVGMTKEEKAKLFKKFLRGSGGKLTHTSGTGLGLYVAKRIVDDHAGKIWAESAGTNKGSTFFVRLPVKLPLPTRKKLLAKDTKAARASIKTKLGGQETIK